MGREYDVYLFSGPICAVDLVAAGSGGSVALLLGAGCSVVCFQPEVNSRELENVHFFFFLSGI